MSVTQALESVRRDTLLMSRQSRAAQSQLTQHEAAKRSRRIHERVIAPVRTLHYYQPSANRLFIVHSSEQSAELKRLCGKEVHFMQALIVADRRRYQPFAEEIDLARR